MIFTFIKVFSVLLLAYELILIFRVLSSWFRGTMEIPAWIYTITDPYLGLFRNIGAFRNLSIDFSPILALGVLSILQQVLAQILFTGILTLQGIVWILISAVIAVVRFFIVFYGLLTVIRFAGAALRWKPHAPAWGIIDMLLNPILVLTMKIFPGKLKYLQLLIAAFIISAGMLALTYLVATLLAIAVSYIPF